MTALDAIGPHEVLSRLPEASVQRVALHAGSIHTGKGLVLTAEFALSDITRTDVLLVPGGGNATSMRAYP